jgi:hypothetical protein
MTVKLRLLRRRGRRSFRRLVFLGALAGMFVFASGAGGLPADLTPPVISVTIHGTVGNDDGLPKTNGWYRSNVTVNWAYSDPESPVTGSGGCNATTLTADTFGTTLTCWAESDGGKTTVEKTITIDKSPPSIATALERQPDANGWYNRPLTVAFIGGDSTSGVGTCSSTTYAGPDNLAASVAGSCSDKAGNITGSSYSFRYDATAPTVSAVTARLGNRSTQLAWRASSDTQAVEVLRAPGRNGQGESIIYRGSAAGFLDTGLIVGRKYEYRVSGVDEAANRSQHTFNLVATGALLNPTPAASVSIKSPPQLVWTPVKGARYYNVQLIRGRKVLSAWPVRPGFRLRRTWIYKGQRQSLRPGTYRWYVWSRTKSRFRLLGSSTFVVTK